MGGKGIEIGAGLAPHDLPDGAICEYFDVRDQKGLAALFKTNKDKFCQVHSINDIKKRFPTGSDFLIAHNVLEHSPNPIKELLSWHGYVKNGGTFVIGVPHHNFCPDKGRALPSIDHILFDYLLDRDEKSFESREHVYSFIMGWINDGADKNLNKTEVAQRAHLCANRMTNDCHWHALDEQLFKQIVIPTAMLKGHTIEILATATPDNPESDFKTTCDIIYVYKIK